MSRSNVTATEALRRLVAEVKLLDAAEVGERWNQLGGVLAVAEGVLRDGVESGIIVAQRLRDAVADPMYSEYAEVSKRLLSMAAENMEAARARIAELEAAAVPAADQPVGAVPEGWVLAGYTNGDELDNMLDDRAAVVYPNRTGFHATEVYKKEK